MNQCIREHDASFFKKQSYFNLFEIDRDEEEFDTNMHIRHQTNLYRRFEVYVSLKKDHDRSDTHARDSLFTSA